MTVVGAIIDGDSAECSSTFAYYSPTYSNIGDNNIDHFIHLPTVNIEGGDGGVLDGMDGRKEEGIARISC